MWVATVSIVACRREIAQRSRSVGFSGGPGGGRRIEVLGVGVEHPERIGVPEGEQEAPHRLRDRLGREAVSGPRLLGGEEVPAEGVGAELVEHLPGGDDVALRLRHLLAFAVEDQAEADDVLVARLVEEHGRLGEQRVEPAAGLVDRLADVVGREALLELVLVLERVVELRERHRARVVPGVDHADDPFHLALAALLALPGDAVDEGAVEVVRHRAGEVLQFLDRAGAEGLVAVLVGAFPDRQGRAPVAVAGESPVDVVLEPLAEAAVLDVLGVPADVLVAGQHLLAMPRRSGCTSSPSRSRAAGSSSASSAGRNVRTRSSGTAGRFLRGARSASSVTSGSLTNSSSKPVTRSSKWPSRPTGLNSGCSPSTGS